MTLRQNLSNQTSQQNKPNQKVVEKWYFLKKKLIFVQKESSTSITKRPQQKGTSNFNKMQRAEICFQMYFEGFNDDLQ